MVVIMADGPLTLRSGRRDSRSISTPSRPQPTMAAASASSSTPASAQPASSTDCPDRPKACSTYSAMKEPTMKTLKWAKLISSRMP